MNKLLRHPAGYSLMILVSISFSSAVELTSTKLESSYRYDALITHGWEHKVETGIQIMPLLSVNAAVNYLDATQDRIAGIVKLHGQIVSGLLGVSWHSPKRYFSFDVRGGFDSIIGWSLKPRGKMTADITAPLPSNRLLQHLKFSPELWYTHSMFNGAAIENRIASYGCAANLGWSMGPKVAAAVNYRLEFLRPHSNQLDSTFTRISAIGFPVNTDTLRDNTKQTFYAYVYRKMFKVLYVGYSYSWTHSRHDRRVITDGYVNEPKKPFEPGYDPKERRYFLIDWAYYPYPTPRQMLAHSLTLSSVFTAGHNFRFKVEGVFPFYSSQKMRSTLPYYEPDWGLDNAWDRHEYSTYTEEYTGPLTLGAEAQVSIGKRLTIAALYDYFGFPYEKWAYFTNNSYSLHTITLKVEKRF